MEKGRSRWGQIRERCSGAYVKFTIILTILHDNLKKIIKYNKSRKPVEGED